MPLSLTRVRVSHTPHNNLPFSGVQVSQKVKDLQSLLSDLDALREELFPLARRATMLFAVLRSLACLQPHYQFNLPYILALFDQALGGEFPEEYMDRDNQDDAQVRRELI